MKFVPRGPIETVLCNGLVPPSSKASPEAMLIPSDYDEIFCMPSHCHICIVFLANKAIESTSFTNKNVVHFDSLLENCLCNQSLDCTQWAIARSCVAAHKYWRRVHDISRHPLCWAHGGDLKLCDLFTSRNNPWILLGLGCPTSVQGRIPGFI